jgi:hypothetical protein
MVVFAFRCSAGNEYLEEFFRLGQAPDEITCPDHGSPARRSFGSNPFVAFPGSHKYDHMPRPTEMRIPLRAET